MPTSLDMCCTRTMYLCATPTQNDTQSPTRPVQFIARQAKGSQLTSCYYDVDERVPFLETCRRLLTHMLELYLPVGSDTTSCAPPDPCSDCSRRSQLRGSLAAHDSLSASLTNTSADALRKMSSHSPHIDARHLLTCIAHGCLEPCASGGVEEGNLVLRQQNLLHAQQRLLLHLRVRVHHQPHRQLLPSQVCAHTTQSRCP